MRHRYRFPFILPLLFFMVLSGVWESTPAQMSKAERYYRGTPVNPEIQAIVDAVSSDSIRSYLERLVGFYTRHTNSDTTSPDTGIGAARRWIKSKYEQWSAATGGRLQPEFFWFTATICGITGLHANVMATLPGALPQAQDRHFIVSGHMDDRTFGVCDATSFAPGANDDGSGTASSIELARVMAGHLFDATLIFMTVTGEDEGLFGSTAYANWAAANNMRIDGMLTNDVIGNIVAPDSTIDSTSVRHFSVGPSTSPSRQLARYFKLKGEQYVPSMTVNLIPRQDRPGRGGDHIPFNDVGYAAVRFTEPAERLEYQHSDLDLIEHMHPPYTAMITKLSAAGLASMALAPETPQAPLMVRDVGDGTSLHLSWTVTNTEPDFAGYRVAWRYADSLFYEQIVPVGMVTEFTLTGLTPDAPIYISYSALDTAGNESIFSQEVLEAPNQIPQTPIGLASTSTPAGVELSWLPNNELDLAGYTITRTAPDGSTQTFEVDSTTTAFLDNTLQPHILYRYTLQARDNDGNLSPPTDVVYGQLATHDQGIMILDASRDGPGVPILPTDEQVDNFYAAILSDFNIARQWDIADSARGITDADMAPFSTVIIHTDVRLPSHLLSSDTLALRKYLQNGGKLLLIGWEAIFSVSENGETIKTFSPGEFVYDYLKTDLVERAAGSDFRGADPLISGAGYPPISVDSVKIPNFGGNLLGMEAFRSLVDTLNTEAIYAYRSSAQPPSPLHGVPVALRHLTGTLQVVVIDFPLYYMEEPQARQAITQALLDLGETTGIGDEDTGVNAPVHFELHQNYPNPFNPSTVIRYALPQTADVRLEIYNLLGQRIATLVNRRQTRGRYAVIWDGRDQSGKPVASGIYLYRLEADHFVQVRKLVLLR